MSQLTKLIQKHNIAPGIPNRVCVSKGIVEQTSVNPSAILNPQDDIDGDEYDGEDDDEGGEDDEDDEDNEDDEDGEDDRGKPKEKK